MATYFVKPTGSDFNVGTSASLAWRTIAKALGTTGASSGDTVYVAPGTYRETITVAGTYSSNVNIIGDRNSTRFNDVPAGYIRITGLISDALDVSTSLGNFSTNGKSYMTFDQIWFEHRVFLTANTTNVTFIRCQITMPYQPLGGAGAVIYLTTTGQSNILFDKCYISGGITTDGSGNSTTTRFNACLWESANVSSGGFELLNTGSPQIIMSNCTVFGGSSQQIFRGYSPPVNSLFVYNCLIIPSYTSPTFGCGVTNCIVENYNIGYINRGGGVFAGANSKQLYHRAFVHSPIYINPIDASVMPYTPLAADNLIGAGSPSFTYGTDYYGNAWANPPSVGAMELKSYGSIGTYVPVERNVSATISPSSTSQSIELFLGVTGLTATTAGLNARYNRTRSASVNIPLVARTITQPWVAGGFAEVDPVFMPGLYRLDLPNEAVASGADDVTVVVRGATGTNGAVVTIKLLPILANANTSLRSAVVTDLSEDVDTPNLIYQTVGDRKPLYFRLFNADGSNPDLTVDGGTIVGIVHNAYSGVEYTFGVGGYSGMTVNVLSDMIGFVEVVPPAIWGTSGMYRLKVRYTLPTGVRIYGPVNIRVGAL